MKTKTNFPAAAAFLVALIDSLGEPMITKQPTDQSVSLGASANFQVSAESTNPPILFQWRFATTNVPNATNSSFTLANIQITNAGDYDAVLRDGSGVVTSRVARLIVDPTFTAITTEAVVTNRGFSFGCAWGDYNNDGFVDLFVCNWPENSGVQHDFLYRNNGNGTFTRVTNVPPVNAGRWATGAAWGDYDNDGNLDLFVTRPQINGILAPNTLYHNDGNGTFTRITTGLIVTEAMWSHAGIWGDVDNDGLLDLVVVNFGSNPPTPARPNYLYRNLGGGTFQRISFGNKSATDGDSWNVAAADFDNDGWLDLFIPQGGTVSPQRSQNSLLYHNNRDGTLTLLTNSVPYNNKANGVACAWGDYDNDGFLDLFVSNFYEQTNSLYHSNGDGTFSLVTNSIVALDPGTSVGCAWGDYDNDGWLDLFVANLGPVDPNTINSIRQENNFLYHNNGDGTFTKVTTGSLVNDLGYSTGCAWGDYDNDGFLDLFVSNGWATTSQNDFLYHNNGNSNGWINFKLVGTASNRSAIGAKVRLKATLAGQSLWQMREISGGSNYGSQNDMRASFGLGDATNVDLVRIEWPSGIVQTLTNVAAKQFITVMEHQEVTTPLSPQFTSVSHSNNGVVNLSVTGDAGLRYLFEASTNLVNWSWLGVRTSLTGSIQFTDMTATNFPNRFYRVVAP